MVISQPALICLESTRGRLLRALTAFLPGTRGGRSIPPAAQPIAVLVPSASVASDGDGAAGGAPAVEPVATADGVPAPLSAAERRARATALRGLLLARQRRYDGARAAFAEAARLDPALDLSTVPTFWDLERGGHDAVVRAYREAGRDGDAALLAARVRQTFRPRIVPASRRPLSTAP